ncbi:MAG TPA: ORF6N domain-containing protein [Rhodocyclaceae bacterium]|nr:ORF6N domain-containing protein [Rhodocyclaceae bacterium]
MAENQTPGAPAPIAVESLPIITYQQQPVVTTELLAQAYGAESKNISDNYLNNATRFVEGKHFFKLKGAELKEFKNRPDASGAVGKNARALTLWTERGAARHAKILNSDIAWDVFEKLEDSYFSRLPSVPPAPTFEPTAPVYTQDQLNRMDRRAWVLAGRAYETYRQQMRICHLLERGLIEIENWLPPQLDTSVVERVETIAFLCEGNIAKLRDMARGMADMAGIDYEKIVFDMHDGFKRRAH